MLEGEDPEAGVSLQRVEEWDCIAVEGLGLSEVAGWPVDTVYKLVVGAAVGCIPSRQ
jgi:hypothetical protein